MWTKYYKYFLFTLLILPIMNNARAGVFLDSTRIIYRESDSKAGKSVQIISNLSSDTPYLVKAQIANDTTAKDTETPFIVTPSLFRLEPGGANQVRILMKPYSFPKDKESLFYFRAIAAPATNPSNINDNNSLDGALQLASANVIKLFYRPNGLAVTPEKAMSQLQFSSSNQGIKVKNPTPYYMTLESLTVNGKAVNIRTTPGINMIAPFSDTTFSHTKAQGAVQWKLINDYGGVNAFNGEIQ